MIDCTGSMGHYNHTVRERCREISDKLKQNKILKNYDIKCERVFYRDPFDCMHDKHKNHPSGTVDELKYRMASIHSYGGGDITEDWLGTYNLALDKKMNWKENSLKIIIHIADAGVHSSRFNDDDYAHISYKN